MGAKTDNNSWRFNLEEKYLLTKAWEKVAGQKFQFIHPIADEVDKMSNDDKLKMIAGISLAIKTIMQPTEDMIRLHELKWVL